MKEKVKELRMKIDGLAQLTEKLNINQNMPHKIASGYPIVCTSDEIVDAVKSLYLAKAWLGKVLGELGTDSPYLKDGSRKTVEDIEPTANRASEIEHFPLMPENWEGRMNEDNKLYLSHIEKVDWLRQEIQEIVEITDPYQREEETYNEWKGWEGLGSKALSYLFNCNRHLSEARFNLGFELARIREDDSKGI